MMDVSESRSVSKVDFSWFISQWRQDRAGRFDLNLSDLTLQSGGLNLTNFSPTKDVFFFQKYNLKASFTAQRQMQLSSLLRKKKKTNSWFYYYPWMSKLEGLVVTQSDPVGSQRGSDLPKSCWEVPGEGWSSGPWAMPFHHSPLPPAVFTVLPRNLKATKEPSTMPRFLLLPKTNQRNGVQTAAKEGKCFPLNSQAQTLRFQTLRKKTLSFIALRQLEK